GGAARKPQELAPGSGRGDVGALPSFTINAVEIAGSVEDEIAQLTVTYGVTLGAAGPSWVPIRLDGLTVTEAKDGRVLPALRVGKGRGWEVELSGPGEHRLVVSLVVAVQSVAEGRRIVLEIPEAAITHMQVDVPRRVIEARLGSGELVGIVPGDS